MLKLLEISKTGVVAILLHPLRSIVTAAALMAVLLPYLVGLGISRGIQRQAEDSVRFGADLYVTGSQLGRLIPLPVSAADRIRAVEGVVKVVPRVVSGVVLGAERVNAVIVGLPSDELEDSVTCVEGRLFGADSSHEIVVGTELARRLNLKVGDQIPPFYRSSEGERISMVVGLFKSDVSLWQSSLIFTSFKTASNYFDRRGMATDLLVYCRPGYQARIQAAIVRTVSIPDPSGGNLRLKVVPREELESILPKGLLHREGIFNLHFVLAFAVGIPILLVTSGFGLSERRREIGILKAIGWQTDEILLRSLVESLLLSLAGASISILLAFIWLKIFNGYWIASIFLTGVDAAPSFQVPSRMTPVPALLAFLLSFVLVMSGTLYSTWRAATAEPMEAMR